MWRHPLDDTNHCVNIDIATNVNEYYSFITEFNNVIGLRLNLSEATKLTYLKNYLGGYALKLIQHLQITDGNYRVALTLLEKEFLDKDAIVDELFSKLIALKPEHDPTYLKTDYYFHS